MKCLFLTDPIATLNPKKDSSIAMMRAADSLGLQVFQAEAHSLTWQEGQVLVTGLSIRTLKQSSNWYEVLSDYRGPAEQFDIVFMRKDPPFDSEFLYATQLLSLLENKGVKVVNRPQALRDFNEKLAILQHPEWITPTLVSNNPQEQLQFIEKHQDVMVKPLDGMGGAGIFRVSQHDPNKKVILETQGLKGQRRLMLQRYIPDIHLGDKRVLLFCGKPLSHALARIPQGGDHRGNLAAGGKGVVMPLTDKERLIAESLGPQLFAQGLYLVGLDIIGGYLTEINVTSPTCMQEIGQGMGVDVAELFLQAVLAS